MKKLKKSLLLLTMAFLGLLIISPKTTIAESNVTVSVTSYFDKDNTVVNTVTNQVYGTKLSFDANLSSLPGYTFVFWIYNGILRQDLPIDHPFMITSNTILIGVFRPTDKYAAIFLDTNGHVLDIQYVTSGGSAIDPVVTLPTKPGYVVASTKWDHSLTNITANTIFTLQYAPDTLATFSLTVTNGTGDGTYGYNAYATIVADAPASGMYFDHWDIGGRVVSLDSTYTFTILESATITAVYTETAPIDHPVVTVGSALSIRSGYHTYVGHFELPVGYEYVEHGLIVSTTADQVLELSSPGIVRHQGSRYNPTTNEFVISVASVSSASARAYLIVKDAAGNLITVYDEVSGSASTVASSLFISEYIEGSSNNKAIEIYNGTGTAVNLSEYKINIYFNGSPTASGTINLLGTLEHNDVFVVANTAANAAILAVSDLTSGSLTFNGNDAVVLAKTDGTLVDVIGVIGTDPGTQWGTDLTSTADNTIVRKSSITSGDPIGSDSFTPTAEWIGYAVDTFGYLGVHSMTGAGPALTVTSIEAHFGVYSYVQGTSLNVTGAYLRAFYSNGTATTVSITSGMVTNFATTTAGSSTLTVTHGGKTTTYPYVVTAVPSSGTVEVHYIDIGATGGGPGESSLIQFGDIDVLIDAGENASESEGALLSFLSANITDGIIEYVIATHQDADHIGGMEVVFANYVVETAILYSTPDSIATVLRNTFEGIVAAEAGITVYHVMEIVGWVTPEIEVAPGVTLEFLNTTYYTTANANYSAIVFVLDAFGTRVLFNADAEQNQEAVYGPLAGDIDIFKMGHHGTANGTTTALLNAIDPEVAIISNGDYLGNAYSHPTYVALSRIYTYSDNLPVYAVTGGNGTSGSRMSERNGTIIVTIDPEGYDITSQYYGVNPLELSNTAYWNDVSNSYNSLGYYYATATGITNGAVLKTAMNDIISSHTSFSYDAIVNLMKVTDADPNIAGNVLLFYTGRSQSAETFVGSTGNQDYWNREHIWAQSHGIDGAVPAYTDLHHLRVTDVSVNSTRGDLDFGVVSPHNGTTLVSDTYGTVTTYNYVSSSYFEPRDEIKGDVARMLFYMAVRYAGEGGEPDLELVNGLTDSTSSNIGDLATLLLWNELDPVDDAERARNEIVFGYQHNRNPFIDHPDMVNLIFGS